MAQRFEMTALVKTSPADDPESDVIRASAAITLVSNRLLEAQADLAELRRSVAETAFMAEIDPSRKKALLDLRTRLVAAESRVGELSAAESVGRDMAAEAQRRALEARKDSDWQAAGDLLAEASVTAAAIDSLLAQAGGLYRDLRQQMTAAGARISPHLRRPEYNVPLPNLDLTLKLVVANGGGPAVPERELVHLDAAERSRASIASVIHRHADMVLRFRPAAEEETSHG
jgi:hypothetical protein